MPVRSPRRSLAAARHAPLQCGHGSDSERAREDDAGDALYALAQDFHAKGNDDASKQTLRYLVEHYPSNRHAPAARAELGRGRGRREGRRRQVSAGRSTPRVVLVTDPRVRRSTRTLRGDRARRRRRSDRTGCSFSSRQRGDLTTPLLAAGARARPRHARARARVLVVNGSLALALAARRRRRAFPVPSAVELAIAERAARELARPAGASSRRPRTTTTTSRARSDADATAVLVSPIFADAAGRARHVAWPRSTAARRPSTQRGATPPLLVYALGGITAQHAPPALRAGADGVAAIRALSTRRPRPPRRAALAGLRRVSGR